ncbi:HCP-like protein [Venustampulla echinocandica]|uniref:HCP-like protein n=1 Tax=Venustampulla echinocandica TaxID=2656787 RepID=A0A370TBZ6_9HELO|nr:HCP-like protein [Venustampulla echinocandica]RDL31771.1 HCP-like protein [Venustampulla echinocandica]
MPQPSVADHPPYTHAEPQSAVSAYIDERFNMSDDAYNNRPPRLSATFIPGQDDDFFAPEIVSPAPQRVMPEVPSNMQEQLSHLELEARNPTVDRMNSVSSTYSELPQRPRESYNEPPPPPPKGPAFTASYDHTNASAYQNINSDYKQLPGVRPGPDSPKFSPFPKPRKAGPNVPLSDEEKEEVLDRARALVLQSSDPEIQLAWAQDVLSWVEVASQHAARLQTEGEPPRPITPKTEHDLRVDALSIVNFLAEQRHPKAEFMKSMWLEFGKFGYRVDKKEAFLGYKRAAERGYARAEYRMGMQFESSNNSAKAIEHYKKGVSMGDSAAHYRLGMMTLLGQHGMPQNYQQGIDLIRFSADTADENAPQGAYVYGMLLAGELPNITVPEQFLPFDLNDAKLFIEKAAYLGFAKAQLKMGQAYELCQLGCEFEPTLSLHYNALAARQGEAEADMAISKWFLCGYEGIFDKNEELAFTYAQRAAQTKMATAEFAMGYFYEIGMYVPVDLRESAAWYEKAAEHGNKDALGRIGSIRRNRTLSKKDHEQVAISRIKSQHGSQRGNRPDRFKKLQEPMPQIVDEYADEFEDDSADRTDMPDPGKSYDGVGQLRPERKGLPPRPVSAAPYPESDLPPIVRPKSAAPYPEDDVAFGHPPGSFQGQGLRPQSGPHSDRPMSAFGIKVPVHANTLDMGARPHDSSRASGGGWEPEVPSKYRQPTTPSQPGFLPPLDVGQPLNLDHPGCGPTKLQKLPPMNPNKPQPLQPQGYGPDSSRHSMPQQGYNNRPADPAVQRRDPSANSVQRPPRGSSMMGPSPMVSSPMVSPQHPPRHDSMAPNPSRAPQRPIPAHTMSSQSAPHPAHDSRASSAAASVSSAPPGPPKKPARAGPATFEEMGIPAGKKEDECTVM